MSVAECSDVDADVARMLTGEPIALELNTHLSSDTNDFVVITVVPTSIVAE